MFKYELDNLYTALDTLGNVLDNDNLTSDMRQDLIDTAKLINAALNSFERWIDNNITDDERE